MTTNQLSSEARPTIAIHLDNAMIDIETLGTKPGAAILSIGAVMFGAPGLGEAFYTPVSLQSCIDVGLTIDPDTVAWWMKQSDEARQAAFQSDAPRIHVALQRFTEWFLAQQARYPWCHGATFDVPLLDAAYAACYLPAPWKFYDVRDTRTLYDLAGIKVDRSKGTHHNALDDARTQAEAAVTALNILNPEGGHLAWAALAENGNVIIWSRRRDHVEPIATKYRRPVVPVVLVAPSMLPQEGALAELPAKVTGIIELYAESYDRIGRISPLGTVECASIATDLRRNVIPQLRKAIDAATGGAAGHTK